jgi:hypothetical protein
MPLSILVAGASALTVPHFNVHVAQYLADRSRDLGDAAVVVELLVDKEGRQIRCVPQQQAGDSRFPERACTVLTQVNVGHGSLPDGTPVAAMLTPLLTVTNRDGVLPSDLGLQRPSQRIDATLQVDDMPGGTSPGIVNVNVAVDGGGNVFECSPATGSSAMPKRVAAFVCSNQAHLKLEVVSGVDGQKITYVRSLNVRLESAPSRE